jgi:enoyl-[acyl-carrier protein] reductase II
VLRARVEDTCLVGRGGLPLRLLRNAFTEKYDAAERSGAAKGELESIYRESSLKKAALEGDIDWGKVEAGQSAGLIEDIAPAAEVLRRLVAEAEDARRRLASL